MSMGVFYTILIIAGISVGIALTWFLIELIIIIRKSRKKIEEVHKQLSPTIDNIESITTKIQPTIDKLDPLVERVSLTIDAANLELMRADQILENVNIISENAASASSAVESIASAPSELLNKAGKKISGLFGGNKNAQSLINKLTDSENINSVVKQTKKQGKRFGRKINRSINNNSNNVVSAVNQKQAPTTQVVNQKQSLYNYNMSNQHNSTNQNVISNNQQAAQQNNSNAGSFANPYINLGK